MKPFLRNRGPSHALVMLIMFGIALLQGGISYTFVLGRLRERLPIDTPLLGGLAWALRAILLGLAIAFWALNRRRALFNIIVITNAFFTAVLLMSTATLVGVLAGLSSSAVGTLIVDVVLTAVSNILIFSIWYWIIDPPGIVEGQNERQPWAFLFPQRGATIPGHEAWAPRYLDYLFVAFTTSFAFSPTDTLPLTRSAKMLMLLQSTVSVITLTGIAGSAINILASRS